MLTIGEIKKIHEEIEQDLLELEVIMAEKDVNYPNFIHTFREINALWDSHEKEEEIVFKKLREMGYGIPYEKVLFSHGKLNKYRRVLIEAFDSGSEIKMKEALEGTGMKLIKELRGHMAMENEVIYRLPEECIKSLRKV